MAFQWGIGFNPLPLDGVGESNLTFLAPDTGTFGETWCHEAPGIRFICSRVVREEVVNSFEGLVIAPNFLLQDASGDCSPFIFRRFAIRRYGGLMRQKHGPQLIF